MRALIVGMGGLGCPASLALAQAGHALTLVDPDRVERSNLHRQLWHRDADLGRLKVESTQTRLKAAFPGLSVRAEAVRFEAANAAALFDGHDVVIDGTDGVAVKFLLSDTAVATGIPLIWGGVLRMEGQAMRIRRGGPCLRCLFETPPTAAPTCAQAGVLGSVAGMVGALQARLVDAPEEAAGEASMTVVDALRGRFRQVTVRKAPDCSGCAKTADRIGMTR